MNCVWKSELFENVEYKKYNKWFCNKKNKKSEIKFLNIIYKKKFNKKFFKNLP